MIKISAQNEFDELVNSTPNNQKILIYPRTDGLPYNLSKPWNIPSEAYIEGVNLPTIKQTEDTSDNKMINISSSVGSELKNIVIKNLRLKGKSENLGDISYGIYCDYVGLTTLEAYYENENYNSTLIGNELPQETGISIIDCHIEGFTQGLYISNTHNSKIIGCTIKKAITALEITNGSTFITANNNIFEDSDDGLKVNTKTIGLIFSSNKLNIRNTAIAINGSKNLSISSNNILDANSGITLTSSRHNSISRNIISNGTLYGISLSDTTKNTITGNFITNYLSGIYLSNNSTKTAITGNTILNNRKNGIYIGGTSNDSYEAITGNTITNNGEVGIFLINTNKNALFSNVYGYNQKGHHLENSHNNFIYGNISYSNSTGNYIAGLNNTANVSQNKFL